MREVTPEQALDIIGKENRVVLILEKSDEPLCKRTRQTLLAYSTKLRQLGYSLYYLEVGETSSKYEQLACARVPQVRIFIRSKLEYKHVGVPTEHFLEDLSAEKFNE